MGIVQRIIRNDAAKSDPKEIYNWRVYLLCASVSFDPVHVIARVSKADLGLGLLWRHAVRDGHGLALFYAFKSLSHAELTPGIIGGVLKLDTFREYASKVSPWTQTTH